MTLNIFDYFVLAIVSFTLTFLLTPIMRKLAIKANFMDVPTLERKTQTQPVPYLGGVAIALAISTTTYLAIFINDQSNRNFMLATSVLGPALIMAMVGLVDDLIAVGPKVKLLLQVFSAVGVAVILIVTNTASLLDFSVVLGVLISVCWVVGLINAVNFFDNHDGASTSAVSISSFLTFLVAIECNQYFVAALALVISTSTAAFFYWNKVPARIYMGDTGALYLGTLLATITIRLKPVELPLIMSIFLVVMIIGIFVLDSSVAVLSRLSRGLSPMVGGKDHLSHRLTRIGKSKTETTLLLQIISVYFGAFAIATLITKSWIVVSIFVLSFAILFKFFYAISHADR